MTEVLEYGGARLTDVYANETFDWERNDPRCVRVRLPAETRIQLTMFKKGYFLADRTIGVQINLANSKIDYAGLIRMEVIESSGYKEEILKIAKASFPDDRRFHFKTEPDPNIAGLVLTDWVKSSDASLICIYKNLPIGFLTLKQTKEDTQFIYLAAVAEKYRATGAAMSLYASAAERCRKNGYKFLEGRISSRNTPVMNIYSFLGAKFKEPEDIYLKEFV